MGWASGPLGARDAFWVFATAPIDNVLHPEASWTFLTFLISDAAAQAAAVSLRAADRAAAPRLPSGPEFHGSVCKKVSRSARCEEHS